MCVCFLFSPIHNVSNEYKCRLPIITITFSRFWPMCFAFKLYHDGSRLLSLKSRFNLDMMLNLRSYLLFALCNICTDTIVIWTWWWQDGVKNRERKEKCTLIIWIYSILDFTFNVRRSLMLSMISISTSSQFNLSCPEEYLSCRNGNSYVLVTSLANLIISIIWKSTVTMCVRLLEIRIASISGVKQIQARLSYKILYFWRRKRNWREVFFNIDLHKHKI